jgi:diguanylate cyclase (GGDEF)-like protein
MPDSGTPQDNPERDHPNGPPANNVPPQGPASQPQAPGFQVPAGPAAGAPRQQPEVGRPSQPASGANGAVAGAAPAHGAAAAAAPAHTTTADEEQAIEKPRLLGGRRLIAAVVAVLCVAAGAIASLLGAHAVARSNANSARQAPQQAAAAISASVKQSLRHEEDIAVGASTYFAGNSKTSPAEFRVWSKWARTLRRYPELDGLGLLTLVHSQELAAFHARITGKPLKAKAPANSGSATTGASAAASTATATGIGSRAVPGLRVVPTGTRPYYCLAVSTLVRGPAKSPPAGLDYCAVTPGMLLSRDSAQSIYAPVLVGHTSALGIITPVYRGEQPPATADARMGAFVGWINEVLSPTVVLAEALRSHPGAAARLVYEAGSTKLAFTLGTPQASAQSTTIALHDGWTVQSFAAVPSTSVLGDGDALALLIVGCVLSALLGVLIFLLGGGRAPVPVRVPQPRTKMPAAPATPSEDLHDALTGLPNRALMIDRAECMLARAGRQSGLLVGALFIDIDWFKDVNEKLGEAAGDQILKIVAQRLEAVVRAGDTVGRLGGDEFVLLVESAARGARLDSLARRVVESLHKPFDLEGFGPNFFLTASIGVAFGRYATPEDLLRDAQLALHAAKSAGKDRYTLFNANMRSVIEGRGVLEVELNVALAEKQFFVLYEPIFDLATGKVAGLDAQIRWLHPKQGVVLPDDFIPLAEETGLTVPIGRWLMEEACGRAAAWNVDGHHVGISVEVTANQVNRDGFVTDVRRALQQSGIEPSMLTLAIAETTVMSDVAAAVERLQELKLLGVRIAIDDFGGSGYAYHSDLRRLPLDFLKVDRSSLAASEDEDYRTWLLEAIMIVGRDLSLTVIAKGIESYDQVAALRTMGCTMAQGVLMGKAVPANAIDTVFGTNLPTVHPDSQNG